MIRRGSPTISQIAEAAGVDKSTVSHVLNGKARQARISVAREAQVLEVARRLNFRPNSAARATRSGSFGTIALLMSTQGPYSTMSARTQCSIHDALARHDISTLLTRLPDEKLTNEGFIPKILRQACVDGLIINYTDHIPDRMVEIMREHRLPSIWVNSKQQSDCIYPADEAAGFDATVRLIARGHRKIAYLNFVHGRSTFENAHYSAHDRQAGYKRAMTDAGLKPEMIRPEHTIGLVESRPFLSPVLSGKNRPTAVLTYGDTEAVTFCFIAMELGRKIHEDIEIATFANEVVVVADMMLPTQIVPQLSLGNRVVEMVIQKIASPEVLLDPVAMPFHFAESAEQFFAAEVPVQDLAAVLRTTKLPGVEPTGRAFPP